MEHICHEKLRTLKEQTFALHRTGIGSGTGIENNGLLYYEVLFTMYSDWEQDQSQSSFFISLVELDEFNKIKLSKIGRLDQGLNPGHLLKSQAC